ncbi:MAG: glutamate-5-semialdehyde dehydrogenase, partial [Actinomycetota bacterium]
MSERLQSLTAGERIVYGGDRCTTVTAALASAFRAGDRLVVVHETGDLLHLPAADHAVAAASVGRAAAAFTELSSCTDEQISDFFDRFAALLADDATFAPIAVANEADVHQAISRGRATGRLQLGAQMRAGMIDGLRTWRDIPTRRRQQVGEVRHDQWVVQQWRDPLGVVGFVFEGRPNVFADATGVLRTGNTVVFRIGSDALATARAIMTAAVEPALRASGLPEGAVALVDNPAHA